MKFLNIKKSNSLKILAISSVAFCGTAPAFADENLFGYVTGAETLPQGAWEAYQWMTWREGKAAGDYSAQDYRTEIEHGITDKLSGALYLNYRGHQIDGSAPVDEAGDAEYPDLDRGLGFQGVQGALKYNFLSPYTSPVGLSLYVEPGYSRIFKITGEKQNEYSLEFKFIAQKNFLDDQLIWAINLTPEFERRKFDNSDEWEDELAVEVTTGLSYRFAPNWYAGLEGRYHSEYPEYGKREHFGVFLGPTIHYGDKKWWATATWLPQVYGSPSDLVGDDNLHLGEHEAQEFRIKIGYNF